MNRKIRVNADKSCEPNDIVIGYVGEKNVDRIVLEVNESLPSLRWYLVKNNTMLPFQNKDMMIDEKLTSKAGTFAVYIIGTDAQPGENPTEGNRFFNTDKIIMRVRER